MQKANPSEAPTKPAFHMHSAWAADRPQHLAGDTASIAVTPLPQPGTSCCRCAKPRKLRFPTDRTQAHCPSSCCFRVLTSPGIPPCTSKCNCIADSTVPWQQLLLASDQSLSQPGSLRCFVGGTAAREHGHCPSSCCFRVLTRPWTSAYCAWLATALGTIMARPLSSAFACAGVRDQRVLVHCTGRPVWSATCAQ